MDGLTDIGNVMIYPTGTNPYHRDTVNPYRVGDERIKALRQLRDTGSLPAGFSVWSNRFRCTISRDDVDWRGMRD